MHRGRERGRFRRAPGGKHYHVGFEGLDAVPEVLRQRRGRVEDHVELAEEIAAQALVLLEERQQQVEPARHVEVHGGRDFRQVLHGGLDEPRHGLAGIDVKRAAVAQQEVEVMTAAEGVIPRQPVDRHRRAVLDERPGLRKLLLVRAQHAVRVDHALRHAGRAGGEQDLRHRLGPHLGVLALLRRAGIDLEHVRNRRRFRAHRGERRLELRRVGGEHQARLQQLEDVFQLAEVLRHQRIRRRDRRDGDADVHRAQRKQRVVHAVVRKDGDRPLGAEVEVEQRLGDAPHGAVGLAVAQLAPAFALALGEESALGRLVRPLRQPFGHAARVGRELLRRAQVNVSVASFNLHGRGSESQHNWILMFVAEPERNTPILAEHEVVVLGGGPAGIAAAAAAGRAGRSTMLIERYGFLGGAGTAAGLANFCGLHAKVDGEHRQVVHGVADEILSGLKTMGALSAPHLLFRGRIQAQAYDVSAYKLAADHLLSSANVRLLFHAFAVGFRDSHLLVETKSGRRAVRGKIFIDCSGDGDLAAWAGAPYEVGDGKGNMLYPSTMYRIGGVDPQKAGNAWERIPELMEAAERKGRKFPRKKPIVRPQPNPVEWRANLTQIRNADGSAVSGIDAEQLAWGEVEGRRQVWDTFQFIRESTPGFERAYIAEIAPQIGIRETRRVRGEYQLSEDDVLDCAEFSDSIGVNGWPVEEHVAGNVEFRVQRTTRGYNQLPYRMLLPQGVENLLVAGRCASMTHGGQSAARVSGPCFVMGQAAGSAAHLCLKLGVHPQALDARALQEHLRTNGAWLG